MASMWRRAMHYLGLGPDEDYDDYDLLGSHTDPHTDHDERDQGDPDRRQRPMVSPAADRRPALRTLSSPTGEAAERTRPTATNGHSPRSGPVLDHGVPSRTATVRPLAVPPSLKPHVVAPAAFSDAQEIADQFKGNVPVIVNLQGVDRDLMRRIIDFASGLCYGLDGQMERVANHVYLLTPSDVEVSAEERRRLHDRGYEA